jgi:hypothetical protein
MDRAFRITLRRGGAEPPANHEVTNPASESQRHADSIAKGMIDQQKVTSPEAPIFVIDFETE